MDSAYKIKYVNNGISLGQFPQKSLVTKGIHGVLNGPTLVYCIQNHIEKDKKALVTVKEKVVNDKKRPQEKISKPMKKRKAKFSVSSFG